MENLEYVWSAGLVIMTLVTTEITGGHVTKLSRFCSCITRGNPR